MTPSQLITKGQWDVKLFNNVYTETTFANEDGETSDISRQTFYQQTLEVFTGIGTEGNFNVGLILGGRSTIYNEVNGSTIDHQAIEAVFYPNDDANKRSALAFVSPSIKLAPFKRLSRFSLQSTFHIPLVDQAESPVFVYFNSFIWENRFFYDILLGDNKKWQLFTEIDANVFFGEKDEGFANQSVFIPATGIISYFPTSKTTIFGLVQHAERLGAGAQNFTQLGIGGKWQVTPELNIELLYNHFVRGQSTGLGRSYNLGLRYVRR